MTRLVRPQELLLLASAAGVPLSLAFTTWPPPIQEVQVVRELAPVTCCSQAGSEPAESIEVSEVREILEGEPVQSPPTEDQWHPAVDFLWITPANAAMGLSIVLALEPDEAWAAGPPRAADEDGVVTREVEDAAIPSGIAAMVGQRVDLYSARGKVCTAVVGAPQLIAEAAGDLEVLRWSGADEDEADEPTSYWEEPKVERRAALAPAVWEHGRQLLVAPLALAPQCGNASEVIWARPHGAGEVAPLEPSAGGRPRTTLSRAFLARPELEQLAEELVHYVGQLGEDAPPSPRLRDYLTARRWRADGRAAVVTIATRGDAFSFEGCGWGLYPEWGIATLDEEGNLGPVHVGPYGELISIVDVTGDGQLELLVEGTRGGTHTLMTLTPTGFDQRSVLPEVPSFGCPC